MKIKPQSFPRQMSLGTGEYFNPEEYFKYYVDWEIYDENKIYDLDFERDSKKYEVIQIFVNNKTGVTFFNSPRFKSSSFGSSDGSPHASVHSGSIASARKNTNSFYCLLKLSHKRIITQ